MRIVYINPIKTCCFMKKSYLRIKAFILLLVLTQIFTATISAQNTPKFAVPPEISKKKDKINAGLKKLGEENTGRLRKANTPASLKNWMDIQNGFVAVDITANGNIDSLKISLQQLGMKKMASFGRVISG